MLEVVFGIYIFKNNKATFVNLLVLISGILQAILVAQ